MQTDRSSGAAQLAIDPAGRTTDRRFGARPRCCVSRRSVLLAGQMTVVRSCLVYLVVGVRAREGSEWRSCRQAP